MARLQMNDKKKLVWSPSCAKTAIVLDKRRIKQGDVYPVKLRITFQRKQVYYSIGIDLSERDFNQIICGEGLTKNEQLLRQTLTAFNSKAAEIIQSLRVFTWEGFEKQISLDKNNLP